MNWYKKANSREVWVDSKGQTVYIKGVPTSERGGLTYHEWNEAKDMQSGSVTNNEGITYVPPFKKAEADLDKEANGEASPSQIYSDYDTMDGHPQRDEIAPSLLRKKRELLKKKRKIR